MSNELRFTDVKLGDTIANRYALESVVNPDNGEAATFMCNYDGWICCAKIYYDDCLPDKEVLDKQRKVSSSHIIKKMDQNVYNKHIYQIMPNFNGNIMSKPVNDKIILEVIVPGVLDALKAIHSEGLIHGNVKPTNIYYNPMGDDILLGDFGVSLDHIGDCNKNIAMNYLPPEVQNGVYDAKSDYYSLGITLIQLITGKNPFEGMNKRNMIKTASTLEFTLPPKVSPVLINIIRGLTVKDYNTRWGADELDRALACEDVEVVDNFVYVPPVNEFLFGETKYTDMTALVTAFASNWNGALDAVKSDAFEEFVDGLDEGTAGTVRSALNDEEENRALFKLIYTFNPDLPFCWKGMSFTDLNSFADEMKRADDKEPYKAILADGALLSFEQFKGADDDTISNVARLSDDAANGMDASVLAFKLDYLLSGQFVYLMDGIPFSDVNTLTSYIHVNVTELKELCHEFITDARFFAWLEVLGYGAQVAEWRAEIG
jgi:hypothetical protein